MTSRFSRFYGFSPEIIPALSKLKRKMEIQELKNIYCRPKLSSFGGKKGKELKRSNPIEWKRQNHIRLENKKMFNRLKGIKRGLFGDFSR